MKPKVLILIATNKLGGPGKGLLQLIRHADHARFNYVLTDFYTKEHGEGELIQMANRIGLNTRLLVQRRKIDLTLFYQVYRILRDEKCNIIQTHGYKGHIIGFALSRFMRIKWVSVAHGWTSENRKIEAYNRLEQILLRFPDVAIAVSPPLFDTINNIRGPKKKTLMVLNAVDIDELTSENSATVLRSKYGVDQNEFVFGVFGRLSPEKGHRCLLNAFNQMYRKMGHGILWVVGEGQEIEALRNQANYLGIADRVKFCGHQKAMRDYLNAVNLTVLPSLSEGLPNVVLESMCVGTPVLATDVGGVREIIRDGVNGWIIPAGDEHAMALALQQLYERRRTLKEIGAAARDSIYPKFSPDIRAEKYLKIYQDLITRTDR